MHAPRKFKKVKGWATKVREMAVEAEVEEFPAFVAQGLYEVSNELEKYAHKLERE